MNQAFDPFNLILLAIALVVFWRLRSVLGNRTGNERPPFDPYAASRSEKTASPEPANGNVIHLPKDSESGDSIRTRDEEPAAPVWTGFAAEGSPAAAGLEKIAQSDSSFTPRAFLDGAKMAYEAILEAFAKGDKAALKNLLSREVFDGFARAIDMREAAGQRLEARFVGIDKAHVTSAELAGSRATLAKDGTVVEGDAKQISETIDFWTFERDVNSRDPNWKLTATEEPV
jgi:predicted lipid-binding transport protein (Tim44 family)